MIGVTVSNISWTCASQPSIIRMPYFAYIRIWLMSALSTRILLGWLFPVSVSFTILMKELAVWIWTSSTVANSVLGTPPKIVKISFSIYASSSAFRMEFAKLKNTSLHLGSFNFADSSSEPSTVGAVGHQKPFVMELYHCIVDLLSENRTCPTSCTRKPCTA